MFIKFRDQPQKYELALNIHVFPSGDAGTCLDRNSGKLTWHFPSSEYNGLQYNAEKKAVQASAVTFHFVSVCEIGQKYEATHTCSWTKLHCVDGFNYCL